MKTIIIILCVLSPALSAFSQQLADAKAAAASAAFQWSETTYDFGKTTVGVPVSFEFRFKNTGLSPLVISSAKATCGCTVTAYTKEPILHGAMGFVKATYDAAKTGVYSKTVTVTANTPEGVVQLTVKGEIIDK